MPPSGAQTIVFAIRGPIARDDLLGLCRRVCGLLAGSGAASAVCNVAGIEPDAVAVDALARLHVAARAYSCRVTLQNASPDLLQLVDFMGIADVVGEAAAEA